MPGFSFSPTMINQQITIITKSGNEVCGIVKEVNPAEIVLKNPANNQLIRLNRDEIDTYTGTDSIKRIPDPLRLHITRCYNLTTRCNGVKILAQDPGSINSFKVCKIKNEFCQCFLMNYFDLQKSAQIKLLSGLQIGDFPQFSKEPEKE